MTPEQFAASLITDVPRYSIISPEVGFTTAMSETEVLAALARAMGPDDLVERLLDWGEYDEGKINDAREQAAARIAAQEAQIKGLQRTYDDLYSDALADAKSDAQEFDSDLWNMVRAYLDELHFDWRDFMEDGVTADEAMTHIRECMNEETRRAEAAEADVSRLRDRLARVEGALTFYSCKDGCNDCSENERDLIGCGWTARAAITEAGQ